MFVSHVMTRNPFTIQPESKITEAQSLMKREHIHRLPVVDHQGRLVGIVAEKDILGVSPSAASTLDMHEMTTLLAKIQVKQVMSKTVISVKGDCLVEEAARLLADNDIGGLPIVDDSMVVIGIVTESDMFRMLLEMFGSRRRGLRLSVLVPEKQGELAALTAALAAKGANVISLGTGPGTDASNARCVIKLSGLDPESARAIIQPLALTIEDVREV